MPGFSEEDLKHKNPCPGGKQIYNFGRPFLGHHCYILTQSDLSLGLEEKVFKEIHQFLTFYPKITSPWGWGSWNLQFLIVLSYRSSYSGDLKMSHQFYMPLRISMRVQFSVYFIPSSCRYKLQRLICNQDLIGPNAEKLCNYNYKSEMSKMTEHNNQITNTP